MQSSSLLGVKESDIAELMLEMRSLTKVMKSRASQRRPRFPFKCRNGVACPFQACHGCWFVHEGDEMPTSSKSEEKPAETLQKLKSTESFHEKVIDTATKFENKLADLSKSIDHRLAVMHDKLEAMADAIIENEFDTKELQVNAHKEDVHTHDVVSDFHEKQSENMKLEIESKIDEKLKIFMKESVKCAFENAMAAFAEHVGARIEKIEGKLDIIEASISEKT